jgi:anti-anti-sigma factor
MRSCSGGAGDNGKLSLPGGKHETLTDGPDEPSVHQHRARSHYAHPHCAHYRSAHQCCAQQHSAHQCCAHQHSAHETGVKVSSDRGMAVVAPLVLVDAGNVQRFWEALVSVSQDHSIIVADLTALPACDWNALSALIMALKYTDITGGELRVAAGSPAVRRVLADAGMDRLFAIFDSLADAMPHREPPRELGRTDCTPA